MGRKGRKTAVGFIDVFVETGARTLLSKAPGYDQDHARALMREIAHEVCLQFGRTLLYVPASVEVSPELREPE